MVDGAISVDPVKWQHRGNRTSSKGVNPFTGNYFKAFRLGFRRGHMHHT